MLIRTAILVLCIACLSVPSKAQTANFTYSSANGVFCSPVSINFTQTSSGNPTAFFWTFGNGQTSYLANPTIAYTAPGSYTVELTAFYDSAALQVSKTIVVNSGITASLTADRNYICAAGVINFTAGSTGNIASYEWNFGDGSPVTNTAVPTASHNYSSPGNYTASVKATDIAGCIAAASYAVAFRQISVTGTSSAMQGCIPALANLTATANIPAGSSVTNYTYNFGDGTLPVSSATPNVSHTYSATGTYAATVDVVTSEGCSITFAYPLFAFGSPPTNNVLYSSKSVYCASEAAFLVGKATNAGAYFWDLGDGTAAVITDTIIEHYYNTLGPKTVTVTPFLNGCAGTTSSTTINIVGVIANFTVANTCSNKNTFNFTSLSLGNVTSYLWDFGDGTPTSNLANPVHTYLSPGSFTALLTVADNVTGCSSSITAKIYSGSGTITNPDTSICRNTTTTFTLSNNQHNPSTTYNWSVLGLTNGPDTLKALQIAASLAGNYPTNYVIVNNGVAYCPDTLYLGHPITVRGPKLSFTVDSVICQNLAGNINNTSSAFNPADSVLLWSWNYGITNTNDTTYQPAPVKFPAPGTYNIKLKARDKTGCVDSLTKPIVVNPVPFVRTFPASDTFCLGQPDTLIAFHTDTLVWSSTAGIPCASCDTIVVNPTVNSMYIASAGNSFGCSMSDTSLIKVYPGFTAQALISPIFLCANDSTRINVSPPGKIISWSPATGLSAPNNYNPVVFPAANTTYTATLTDSAGCFTSTATVQVNINASPTVDAGPDQTYSYNTAFTITPSYSNNIAAYIWSPAGTLSCSNCANPGGNAAETVTYMVQVTSDSGCVAKDTISIFVDCSFTSLLMPSAFTPNGDTKNDVYYPIAKGISLIKRLIIFNRYGQVVFEAKNFKPNNPAFGWDGSHLGEKQTPGAYVYLLEATCGEGTVFTKKDSFLLLR